jgi:hypothetical protein
MKTEEIDTVKVVMIGIIMIFIIIVLYPVCTTNKKPALYKRADKVLETDTDTVRTRTYNANYTDADGQTVVEPAGAFIIAYDLKSGKVVKKKFTCEEANLLTMSSNSRYKRLGQILTNYIRERTREMRTARKKTPEPDPKPDPEEKEEW